MAVEVLASAAKLAWKPNLQRARTGAALQRYAWDLGGVLQGHGDGSGSDWFESSGGSSDLWVDKIGQRETGRPPDTLLAVSMIMSAPHSFERRALIRLTLEELTRGVFVAGYEMQVVVRFAVGGPPIDASLEHHRYIEAMLAAEARTYGDIAFLSIRDGYGAAAHAGKNQVLFQWAVRHFPDADLIFKQDDDTLVDWHNATARMLDRAFRGRRSFVLPLERLYLGRQCTPKECGSSLKRWNFTKPCGAGTLYGLSGDVARWVVDNIPPMAMFEPWAKEDMVACWWMDLFEEQQGPLERHGLLQPPAYFDAWIHGLKAPSHYFQCYADRENGCWSRHQIGRAHV